MSSQPPPTTRDTLRDQLEVAIQQLTVHGSLAFPCAVCRRTSVALGVNDHVHLLREVAELLSTLSAREEAENVFLIERSPRANDQVSAVVWYWTGLIHDNGDGDVNYDPWVVMRFPRRDYAETVLVEHQRKGQLRDFRVVAHGFVYRESLSAREEAVRQERDEPSDFDALMEHHHATERALSKAESQRSALQADRDALREALTNLREEFYTMQRVAGQASVEGLDIDLAAADARFAGYCGKWAGQCEAALHASPQTEKEKTK